MNYSIGTFASLTNLSAPTIRYYEKEELIIVSRDAAGRRFFTENDVSWISFIQKLKDTGMSIKAIKKYAILRYQGDSTLGERLDILTKHRLAVIEEKAKWEANLLKLDDKIKYYENAIKAAKSTKQECTLRTS